MHPLETILTPLGRLFRGRRSGEATSPFAAARLSAPIRLDLSSPSFVDGTPIPDRFCGWLIGEDVCPELAWGEPPAGTVQLAVVLEDLDSPGTSPRLHLAATLDPTDHVAEDALRAGASGIRFLQGPKGPLSYRGPRPLPGHGPHHYRFSLFALSTEVEPADAEHLPAAMAGRVLAVGTLTGLREA